jgi:predicted 3-demethylubiquinone-9 3-methyltransferase (glyoxalase superfamily)
MPTITPFLWFDRDAEAAARFYVKVFRPGRLGAITRYGEGARGPAGAVMTVAFRVLGQDFIALNGGPVFTFNEAVSFVVRCRTQREVDRYWRLLTADGGQAVQCGWLKDKFGVSWQIVPDGLMKLLGSKDAAKAARVTQAMLGMKKLDLRGLQRAADRREGRK